MVIGVVYYHTRVLGVGKQDIEVTEVVDFGVRNTSMGSIELDNDERANRAEDDDKANGLDVGLSFRIKNHDSRVTGVWAFTIKNTNTRNRTTDL